MQGVLWENFENKQTPWIFTVLSKTFIFGLWMVVGTDFSQSNSFGNHPKEHCRRSAQQLKCFDFWYQLGKQDEYILYVWNYFVQSRKVLIFKDKDLN